MLHDLIKAATRNLEPGADPEKDWLKYADDGPCFITREEMEDAEFIELDEEDEYEYEECECEEDDDNTFILYTTIEEIGYDDSLQTIEDSEILEEFVRSACKSIGEYTPKKLLKIDLSMLDFIEFDESVKDDTITVTIYKDDLRNYFN